MGAEIGTLSVRRSILIDAEPERVWKEFESFERMTLWFGTGHQLVTYEPRIGGRVEVKVDEEGSMRFGGRVTVFEPSRELTFEDRWLPADDSAATSLLTIRLTPALGGTLVELIDHGFERLDGDVAEVHRGYEAAWDLTQLNALQDLVSA